jgi:formylglycine-generating enzyme required for sulfatase activity
MKRSMIAIVGVVAVMLAAGAATADVFNMGGGLTSLEFVTVGNPGNAKDNLRGTAYKPYCGAVAYTYDIGKYEVTAGQYTAFLNAVAKTDTYGLYNALMDSNAQGCQITRHGASGNYTYDFSGRPSGLESDWVNRPVNYVTWGDAARFANWLTNGQLTGNQDLTTTEGGSYYLNGATTRAALMAVVVRTSPPQSGQYYLPTEDEWYKAAYYDPNKTGGAGYWDYATGTDTVPSNVLTDPDPGNNANYCLSSQYTIGSPYYRTEVGDFENSESPYGTFDQNGNVSEWYETAVIANYGRGVRGGSYVDSTAANLKATNRNGLPPETDYNNIGFRISTPEPATMALLALGGIGLLARRRRGK